MSWLNQILIPNQIQIQSDATRPDILCWSAEVNVAKLSNETLIVVAEDQIAIFVNGKEIVAILEKGTYPWHWVFEMPPNRASQLKIYFFSTKLFSDQRWGTPTPILISDNSQGLYSLRAHGAFSYHIDNPKKLWRYISNALGSFSTENILPSLRAVILEQLSHSLNHQDNLTQLLKEREKLSQKLTSKLTAIFDEQFGLALDTFIIQSISLPEQEANQLENYKKIEKLNELYRQGILTQEEFEEKKKMLLKDL